jgi:hypothetical protein
MFLVTCDDNPSRCRNQPTGETEMTTATNGDTTTTTSDEKGKTRAAPTAIEAITKIGKILDQLSASDRKRVLAFVNESNT